MTERRKYIRLDSVFPVQFRILSLDNKSCRSDWLQGFTSNVGRGGICLEVNNLKPELAGEIKTQNVSLSLSVEMPLGACPITVEAKPVWVREISQAAGKYIIGLSYENMLLTHNNRIMRVAWTKKLFAPVSMAVIIVLGVVFLLGSYLNVKLITGNKALVDQLIGIIQESTIAKQKVKQINKDKEDLQIKIHALQTHLDTAEGERAELKEKVRIESTMTSKRLEEISSLVDRIIKEKDAIQQKMIALQGTENAVAEKLLLLDQKKATLEKANLDKMYQWLKAHQNSRTGLVMSCEGDNEIANWAFVYDQSLAVIAYSYFGDFSRAKKTLNFFDSKAKKQDGKFLNAYFANDGHPAEYVVRCGPNIWLGIAIMQYTKKSHDRRYLKLAEEIASGIMSMQNEDADGGIRGGPQAAWYATEHNLDAYAFFNMLYAVTQKEQYLKARDKVLNWLVANTYNKADLPSQRGKGDATIVTDTYAWSIAAVGPDKLVELGMNPDRIIEFAQKNCSLEVDFVRPEGKIIKIKGFDFAPQRHLARGGVISTEWTAQMVLSFRILAEYYYKKGLIAKARSYEFQADEYLVSLTNMVISSPSPSGQGESCLPYASADFVDTGHGWITPKGKLTGSVSGTAYTLFAYHKFNPLQLLDLR